MIDNPFWDICEPHAEPSGNPYKGPQVAGLFGSRPDRHEVTVQRLSFWERRSELANQYSWSIPDPPSVYFVRDHCRGKIIDPIAGTGYWAYLLTQVGVDCVSYDLDPPMPDSDANQWHRFTMMFVAVKRADAAVAVTSRAEKDRTLFLSWPPYDTPLAADILKAYQGDRVIYIGEGAGGCCADDEFFSVLDDWKDAGHHTIAQWGGMHDYIAVYDRIR